MPFILFDLDGTLIDSTDAILESFSVAFDTMGDEIVEARAITALIGHPLDKMFMDLGVNEAKVWDYVSAYKAHYMTVSKPKTVLLPTAKEAVALAANYGKLAVVTTKTSKYSEELLEHLGILNFFDVLIGREDVLHPKPHPEPVQKAIEALGASKENSWMIGDTCMDMISAQKAGVKGVAVTCGYGNLKSLQDCTQYIESNPLMAVQRILK
jgi:phosphoglycolate phosphatase